MEAARNTTAAALLLMAALLVMDLVLQVGHSRGKEASAICRGQVHGAGQVGIEGSVFQRNSIMVCLGLCVHFGEMKLEGN